MKSKLLEGGLSLVFAVACGALSSWATWALCTTIYDAVRATAWVEVPATVERVRRADEGRSVRAFARYRYRVDGRDYTGTRLGIARVNGAENVGDWQDRMFGRLEAARDDSRTIDVYVNPRDPAVSVVDRELRGPFVVFLLPFMFAFGGMAIALIRNLRRVLRPAAEATGSGVSEPTRGPIPAQDGARGVLAFAAFLWCSVAFPVAALYMPGMIAAREWAWLLVPVALIAIGVALFAVAVVSFLGPLTRGRVLLELDGAARAGEPLSGTVSFARGVSEGDRFLVTLTCTWVRWLTSRVSGNSSSKAVTLQTVWSHAEDRVASGRTVGVRFDLPVHLPGTQGGEDDDSQIRWTVSVEARGPLRVSSTFIVAVEGPIMDALSMSRLLPASNDAPKTMGHPWVAYGVAAALLAAVAGAALFTLVAYASAFIDVVSRAFR